MSKNLFFGKYPPTGLAYPAHWGYNNLVSDGGDQNWTNSTNTSITTTMSMNTIMPTSMPTDSHGHVHENQQAVLNRLSRAIGHLEKVRRMVENGEDCSDVLIQLAAVRSALDNTGKVILKDHMRHCMVDAVAAGDQEAIDDLCQAIDKFMK